MHSSKIRVSPKDKSTDVPTCIISVSRKQRREKASSENPALRSFSKETVEFHSELIVWFSSSVHCKENYSKNLIIYDNMGLLLFTMKIRKFIITMKAK